jgi:putative ABC transport system permease protein
MLRATLRSLLARKLRLLLSGIAVILGVAFVSGTYVLTDTMSKAFDNLFNEAYKGTAVAVQGTSALGGGFNDREPVPQAVLDKVRRVPGVTQVSGAVSGYAQVVQKDGKAYSTGGAPSFGGSLEAGSPLETSHIRQGRAPRGPNEVVIDAVTVRRAKLAIGSPVKVLLKGPARTFTLVGTAGLGDTEGFGGASVILFDPPTAQRYLGTPGTWSIVTLGSDGSVSDAELKRRVEQVLPKGFEALTGAQQTEDTSKDIKEGLGVITTVLQVFGYIALFVGMFLIFNTFSMLVAQRTKELALMRALGASRGQVTQSVLVEASVIGFISAVIGFLLGIVLAIGLRAMLTALGIELPGSSTVIKLRTFVLSMLIGVAVTVLAALIPARRAARVSPVQAMRDSTPAEDQSLAQRSLVGAAITSVGVALIAYGLNGGTLHLLYRLNPLAVFGVGAAVTFLGLATLSPFVAKPVVGLLGRPARLLGAPSALGRANAMRSPRRTAATASALMIGLALVAMMYTIGQSAKTSLGAYVERSLGADFVMHTDQFEPFSPDLAARLARHDEFALIAAYRFGRAKVDGDTNDVQGVDAKGFETTLKVQTVAGDLGSIDRGELAVAEGFADSHSLKVGDRVDVVWSRTGNKPMRIGAIYKDNLFAGNVNVGEEVIDANVTEKLLGVIAVTLDPGVSAERGRQAVDAEAKDFPNVEVQDQSQLIADQRKFIDGFLNIITVLLALSVMIALLGVVNTLALSVVERTRELGLLRAVGLARRQMRRMIRVESVLISFYGAILGIVIGLCFGAAVVHTLKDEGIDTFALPVQRLVLVLVAAGIGGVIAAALPARRAARLNVLTAIAEE